MFLSVAKYKQIYRVFSPLVQSGNGITHNFHALIFKSQIFLLKEKWDSLTGEKKTRALERALSFISLYHELGQSGAQNKELITEFVKEILLDLVSIFSFKDGADPFEYLILDFFCNNRRIYKVFLIYMLPLAFTDRYPSIGLES